MGTCAGRGCARGAGENAAASYSTGRPQACLLIVVLPESSLTFKPIDLQKHKHTLVRTCTERERERKRKRERDAELWEPAQAEAAPAAVGRLRRLPTAKTNGKDRWYANA